MSPPVRPGPAANPFPPDPAARPRPLAQRLGLLCILLLLPMAAVALPTVVLTHFFGQRPRPKVPTPPPAVVDTSALRAELDGRADHLLPTPAPLTADPIRVSVLDPSHVDPRMDKVKAQAQAFGGAAVEGLGGAGEKHLFVDLPAGAADAFRRAVVGNAPVASLPAVPSPAASPAATRDQVEVFIRAAANDE